MKPSLTPCFFSNTSLYWLRRFITADMSTSLKVVSIAAVAWASLSRRAMVWRSLVIFTRSSREASSGARWRANLHGRRPAPAAALAAGGDRGQHVALGDAAILARGADGRGVDAALGREPAHGRAGIGGLGCRLDLRVAGDLARLLLGGGGGLGAGLARSLGDGLVIALVSGFGGGRGGRAGAGRDHAEQSGDADRLAFLGDDLAEHAGGRRVDLERHLVGFEFDQRLVGLHRVAGLLEPLADGGLGDGFAEGRYADFSRHCQASSDSGRVLAPGQAAKASSRNALSCARCFDIRPVAVAAEAGRPT